MFSILLSLSTAHAQGGDALYSAGFSAYLNKNYDEAQQHWLKAAELEHARAMFNLGLLHEQGKIADASSSKADDWFVLASKRGYVAADYQLGLRWLAQGGRDEEANALISKAAQAGYAAARRHGKGRVVAKSKVRLDSKVSSPSKYLGETWIKSKRPDYWTIQMLASKDRSQIESFIDEHQLHREAAYFTEGSGDGILYKLIYGAYDNKDKAEFARQNLPPAMSDFGPWLRPISSVQRLIKEQN